jgi:hypothetical protein
MTRFAKALGDKYESAISQIRTKTFTFGNYEFKVRLPLTAELDALYKRVAEVPDEVLKARVDTMTAALRDAPPEGVTVTDTDVLVNGNSTREVALSLIMMENRITEYFRLLIPLEGTFDDISYEEINAEFPFPTQLEMVDAISAAIQPGYKDARKN